MSAVKGLFIGAALGLSMLGALLLGSAVGTIAMQALFHG